jgi:hypothetical protein
MIPTQYVCECRACSNHYLVEECARATAPGNAVHYSDGYVGGQPGVQTEVVTCPHCGQVSTWRKNCRSVESLRQQGNLDRFRLPSAAWGPRALYWTGFRQSDRHAHPADPAVQPGVALPRLTQPPQGAALEALRKRGALALGVLWLYNDCDRVRHFFGGARPLARSGDAERRRPLLLRALLESALFCGDGSERNAIEIAEWHRELGEWDAAVEALDRPFEDPVLADRARQLAELIDARNATVAAFEAPAAPPVPVAPVAPVAPAEEPPAPPAPPAPLADSTPPRALLATLLEVLGSLPADTLTRRYIARPYGALLRTLMKDSGWDPDTFAVAVIRGFVRAHGCPDGQDEAELAQLEIFEIDEALLDYLAQGFRAASWDRWAFEPPATPAPQGRGPG